MAVSCATLVVRRTFLELVDESHSANRCRAFTDTFLTKDITSEPSTFDCFSDDTAEPTSFDCFSDDTSEPTTSNSFTRSSRIGAWCDVSDSDDEDEDTVSETTEGNAPATVMLKGIPRQYTRAMLCTLLDSVVAGCYDFVYLPQSFRKRSNNCSSFGYAFVNFCRIQDAQVAMDRLAGFNDWEVASDKVLDIVWSTDCNGLSALVERYRNNPVMHRDVPDDCKPIILACGERVQFPPPTTHIQAPPKGRM